MATTITTSSRPSPSASSAGAASCRLCEAPLHTVFADLGNTPLANSYLTTEQLRRREPVYPLKALVCDRCLLVQLQQFERPQEIFNEYAYFSSYSDSWLRHAREYAQLATSRFQLGPASRVVEIGSNDGYLLQFFLQHGTQVLGIEPAANVAQTARDRGIPTCVEFFSADLARQLVDEGRRADLIVGNNVLAHVPALRSFVQGLKILLDSHGVITLEFPHLLRLVERHQFDTIYHEHFSYFSLLSVGSLFDSIGLTIFDVEQLPTHGGSLRIYARHAEATGTPVAGCVAELLDEEVAAGMSQLSFYKSFADKIGSTRRKLVQFVAECRKQQKSIVGYGAPAKGNTLLNFCQIGRESIEYTVDRNPHKQGCYLPGSRIPILNPERIQETKPDYLLVLPWNLLDEIMQQMAYVRRWGCRFVLPIPELKVLS